MARTRREVAIAGTFLVAALAWAVTTPPDADAALPSPDAAAIANDAGSSSVVPVPAEEDGTRSRLAALEALYCDGGGASQSLPARPRSLIRARAMIGRADNYAAARRVDEARLAESTARTWIEVTEHGIALERDRARDNQLDAGASRARSIIANHALTIAVLYARKSALTQTLGARESQLARPKEATPKRGNGAKR